MVSLSENQKKPHGRDLKENRKKASEKEEKTIQQQHRRRNVLITNTLLNMKKY